MFEGEGNKVGGTTFNEEIHGSFQGGSASEILMLSCGASED
jgi:hypothetical protein